MIAFVTVAYLVTLVLVFVMSLIALGNSLDFDIDVLMLWLIAMLTGVQLLCVVGYFAFRGIVVSSGA